MFEVDEKYLSDVQDRVSEVLKAPLTFCALVERCQGAYPQTIKTVLDVMIDRGLVRRDADRIVLATEFLKTSDDSYPEPAVDDGWDSTGPELPDPHPADYDWRFTPETRLKVSKHLAESVKPGGLVALLGAPTLLPHVVSMGLDPLLIDRSEPILGALEKGGLSQFLLRQDLFMRLPGELDGKFQAVVADPPWYLPFFEAFLLRAAECAQIGAEVLVSFPPRLTRPDVGSDREHVVRVASELGLNFVSHEESFFRYETPGFERVALAESGVECLDWRSGDLLSFSRTEMMAPERPTLPPKEEPQWLDYRVKGVRVKVRLPLENGEEFLAEEVNLADLDGVSRRAPVRGRINVWTTANRAYHVEGLRVLDAILRGIEDGCSVNEAVEKSAAIFNFRGGAIERLTEFVNALINA